MPILEEEAPQKWADLKQAASIVLLDAELRGSQWELTAVFQCYCHKLRLVLKKALSVYLCKLKSSFVWQIWPLTALLFQLGIMMRLEQYFDMTFILYILFTLSSQSDSLADVMVLQVLLFFFSFVIIPTGI